MKPMIFREANPNDITQIQVVRLAVKENVLSDSALVTDGDCEDFMTQRGKGWVCEVESKVVGFAIVDLKENNVWALFIHPSFEKKGIGRKLHQLMLAWYFEQTSTTLWLGTSPETRAEQFYRKSGWAHVGNHGPDEIKFEMKAEQWLASAEGEKR